jgi:arginine deiminase
MDRHPKRTHSTFEEELQRENQRITEIHSELEQMLQHARERSQESRKRVMASMGLLHNHRMFIRH